jgi:hypothetical protein
VVILEDAAKSYRIDSKLAGFRSRPEYVQSQKKCMIASKNSALFNHFWYDQTFRSTITIISTALGTSWFKLTPCLGCQPVERVVTFALRPHLSAEGERSRSVQSPPVGIDIDDANLHGGMILGGNKTVYT